MDESYKGATRSQSGGGSKRRKFKGVDVPAAYAAACGASTAAPAAPATPAARKPRLNVVIVGHVDAGKSTLMGHLLHLHGEVDARQMRRYESQAAKEGKGSFKFAWVLDETDEERSRGVTVDVANAHFETQSKAVTVLDAPGHRDYTANAITGAVQADLAVLVVDARTAEFEAGFGPGGQTREHAVLARALGVQQLVVAVNKMDAVDPLEPEWPQQRFDEIRGKLAPFCKSVGFKKKNVLFIPVSGFEGHNLIGPPPAACAPWYTGPTLIAAIDGIEPPVRDISGPVRLVASNVYKTGTGGAGAGQGAGLCIEGHIFHGCLQPGETLMVAPNYVTTVIKTIAMDGVTVPWAVAGDHIVVVVAGVDSDAVPLSSVLCDPDCPLPSSKKFVLQIATFDLDVPITKGFSALLHFQQRCEPVVIEKLLCTVDRASGAVLKKRPRVLGSNRTAKVRVRCDKSLCLARFDSSKPLGRVVLRSAGHTIAAGIVLEQVE